jgi:hypothetical protein
MVTYSPNPMLPLPLDSACTRPPEVEAEWGRHNACASTVYCCTAQATLHWSAQRTRTVGRALGWCWGDHGRHGSCRGGLLVLPRLPVRRGQGCTRPTPSPTRALSLALSLLPTLCYCRHGGRGTLGWRGGGVATRRVDVPFHSRVPRVLQGTSGNRQLLWALGKGVPTKTGGRGGQRTESITLGPSLGPSIPQ